MSNTLYRFVKASERLPELAQRQFLLICGEYSWTGDFIKDEGGEIICRVEGQNRPMFEKEFSEIEWLEEFKVEANQLEFWSQVFAIEGHHHLNRVKEILMSKFTLIPKQ